MAFGILTTLHWSKENWRAHGFTNPHSRQTPQNKYLRIKSGFHVTTDVLYVPPNVVGLKLAEGVDLERDSKAQPLIHKASGVLGFHVTTRKVHNANEHKCNNNGW